MIADYTTELSIETVILQQELKIGDIAARIYLTPRSEWQTNINNYFSTVNALESMAWAELVDTAYPLMKKQLEVNANRLLVQYHKDRTDNPASYARKGRNYEMSLFQRFIELKWAFIQVALQRKGLLRKKRQQAVDTPYGMPSREAIDETGILKQVEDDLRSRVGDNPTGI